MIIGIIFIFGFILVFNLNSTSGSSVQSSEQTLNDQAVLNSSVNPISTTNSGVNNTNYQVSVETSSNKNIVSQKLFSDYSKNADVSISQKSSNYNPNYLKSIILSIRVTNNGPDQASGITVNYLLKSKYLKWISDNGNGAYNPKTGLWNVGTLDNGTSNVLNICTQVVSYNNSFESVANLKTGEYIDTNSDNDMASINITLPKTSDLLITQSSSQHYVQYLHSFYFLVVVKNLGPNPAHNVTVNCYLNPSNFKYISDNRNGYYNPVTGVWTISSMKPGSQATLRIIARVLFFNSIAANSVSTQSDTYDYNRSNNRAKMGIHVPSINVQSLAADLAIGTKTKYARAVNIFNWVRDHISYSFYYNTKYGASGTLKNLKGNCADTAHLVVALARASGLPARYKHGTCYFIVSQHWYGHVWANIYVNGKWYAADATSSRNTFGVIRNWDTSNFTLHGTYNTLPF